VSLAALGEVCGFLHGSCCGESHWQGDGNELLLWSGVLLVVV